MNGRRRSVGQRDQHASVFSASLLRLCDAVGAPAAAIVDAEGETVDYAGSIEPFDIKIAAAEWAVVFARLKACRSSTLSGAQELRVRGARKSYLIRVLAPDYVLLVQLLPRCFALSARALNEALREIALEAELPPPPGITAKDHWVRVDVRCEPPRAHRPFAIWVKGSWVPVEVIGHWNIGPRELGYRARLTSGAEFTLVRERLGRWYAEAPLPF